MWFVVIGVLIQVFSLVGIWPVGDWSWSTHWMEMIAPFALALVWWWVSDALGWTQKKAMDDLDARQKARRDKQFDAMGISPRKKR